MTGGVFFATVFFVLLTFAAWTSAIGLMEPAVAWCVESLKVGRSLAAMLVGFMIWLLGLGSVLSFNVLADTVFYKGTIFDNVDHVTSNIMLPLGGVLITVFAAWIMCRNSTSEELGGAGQIYKIWRLLARYVAPVAILFVFLKSVGLMPEFSGG
jgi:NSS family neurotransmitter:Na+ symporter